MGLRMLGKEMANVQINVVHVVRHIQRLKLLYLLVFCLIDKADVFGHMCTQVKTKQHQSVPSNKEDAR